MEAPEKRVRVVRVNEITKIEESDHLGVVRVYNCYPCVVPMEDFKPGDLAAYVPCGAIVDTSKPEFGFLMPTPGMLCQVWRRKYFGFTSWGLLLKLPTYFEWTEGDDLTTYYSVIFDNDRMVALSNRLEGQIHKLHNMIQRLDHGRIVLIHGI